MKLKWTQSQKHLSNTADNWRMTKVVWVTGDHGVAAYQNMPSVMNDVNKDNACILRLENPFKQPTSINYGTEDKAFQQE